MDALIVYCDGNCEELIPLWIEGVINGLYSFKRAANMDPLSCCDHHIIPDVSYKNIVYFIMGGH